MVKLSGASQEETDKIVPANTILLGYVGSISHGTYVPKNNPNCIDDKDILGICIGPEDFYLGLGRNHFLRSSKNNKEWTNSGQQEVVHKEWDSVVFEIKKFIGLLLKSNPNVICLLWLPENCYIYKDSYGKELIANREIFSSKYAYKSFLEYSKNQFHKMTHCAFQGYMGDKRKSLVEEFGFDCKNASHLIRLMRMCIEFLTTGEFLVQRPDAKELKEIKSGGWTLDQVKKEAERLFILAQEALVRSKLPDTPNFNEADKLLTRILKNHFELCK